MKAALVCAVSISAASCSPSQEDETANSSWAALSGTVSVFSADPGRAVMPKTKFDAVAKSYRSEYSETAETQACLVQSVHSCMSQAISRKAAEKSDLRVCDDLSDENFRKNCKTMVAPSLAEKTGDPKICDELDEMNRRWCYSQAFVAKARRAKDPSACAGLASSFPTSTGSAAGPAAWSVEVEIRRCESSVISGLARKKEDCAAISEPVAKSDCEMSVRMRSAPSALQPMPAEAGRKTQ